MLPSKGYFRSIDCPFYKNNLCHRFYCHFRHNRKEGVICSDSDVINCEENINTYHYNIQDASDFTPITTNQQKPVTSNSIENKLNSSDEVVKNVNLNARYSLPANIPQYKPTPISQLKIRHKQINENTNNENSNATKKLGLINKTPKNNPNLIETLVDYFMENNEDTNKQETINDSKSKNTKEISLTNDLIQLTSIDKVKQQHGNKVDCLSNSNIHVNEQENMKLKAMINQLENIDQINEPKFEKEILDNETLLEDLLGTDNTSDNKEDIKEIAEESEYQRNSSRNHKLSNENQNHTFEKKIISLCDTKPHNQSVFKSIKSKNSETNYKQLSKKKLHLKGTKSRKSSSSCKHNTCKNTKHNRPVCKKRTNKTRAQPNMASEIILISDSDEDCVIPVENNTMHSEAELPQPKHKIRISRVANQNPTTEESYSHSPVSQNAITTGTNDHLSTKQKLRFAHSFKYSTHTLRTVEDHLSHWKHIRDRVKNKCKNPSEEPGYQNWTNVKICPVSNVESLMHSKRLLYSKLHKAF